LNDAAPLLEVGRREAPAGVSDLVGRLENGTDFLAAAVETGTNLGDCHAARGHLPLRGQAFLQGAPRSRKETGRILHFERGVHGGE